jgi:hypothetical protein
MSAALAIDYGVPAAGWTPERDDEGPGTLGDFTADVQVYVSAVATADASIGQGAWSDAVSTYQQAAGTATNALTGALNDALTGASAAVQASVSAASSALLMQVNGVMTSLSTIQASVAAQADAIQAQGYAHQILNFYQTAQSILSGSVTGTLTAGAQALATTWGNIPGLPNIPTNIPSVPLTAPDPTSLAAAAKLQAQAQLAQFSGQVLNVNSLLSATGLNPAQVQGMASTAFGQLSAGAQQAWNAQTSPLANDARVVQGAQAGVALITNGFDPSNPADEQQLIMAIAGAVSLIPGIGPVLGAAIVVLDAIGEVIAQILEAVGLIWFGCRSSNNWSASTIMAGYADHAPPTAPNTFAALAYAAICQNAATYGNCKGTLDNQTVLASVAHFWNQNSSGPPFVVYVPCMYTAFYPFPFVEQIPHAFQPVQKLADVPNGNWTLNNPGQSFGQPFDSGPLSGANNGNLGKPTAIAGYGVVSPPMLLQLSGSTFVPPTSTPATSSIATAAKVVGGTAAVAAAGAGAWWLLGAPLTWRGLRSALGMR